MTDELESMRYRTLVVEDELHEMRWAKGAPDRYFASYRLRKGVTFAGVRITLEKPHGLKPVMMKVLRLVSVENMCRYRSILRHSSKDSADEAVLAMQLMVRAGIVAILERNSRPSRGPYFEPYEVQIDDRAIEELEEMMPPKRVSHEHNALKLEIEHIREQWPLNNTETAARLQCLVEHGVLRLAGSPTSIFPLDPRAWKQFRSVLLVLAHARAIRPGEMLPLRGLSTLLWGDSKALDRYKRTITKVAGMSLHDMGLITHPDTLWAYGDVTCCLRDGSGTLSLAVGKPPVLSEGTALNSRFYPGPSVRSILVVENLTVFLVLYDQYFSQREGGVLLWSDGYAGRSQFRFIRDVITQARIPVFVWADMDGDGLSIAQHICTRVKRWRGRAEPILMGTEEWEMAVTTRRATAHDQALLANEDIRALFPELSEVVAKDGRTVEQEALLRFWPYICERLDSAQF